MARLSDRLTFGMGLPHDPGGLLYREAGDDPNEYPDYPCDRVLPVVVQDNAPGRLGLSLIPGLRPFCLLGLRRGHALMLHRATPAYWAHLRDVRFA